MKTRMTEQDGRPYGIDVLMPNKYAKTESPDARALLKMIPEQNKEWLEL